MSETLTKHQGRTISAMVKRAVVIGLGLASGACVNVSAPDKPIVINLNISVTQEVVYRLDNEAKSLIKQNPGIF
ncbi:YnbE family lipoprotein [Sphingomonas mucosissima]|uniref:YnbE-like lipoprotein n=1 Tax=Sphingomonas mucosissima TaxID=370959 RepID=A0A245ZQE3_9SPHN|nr:hypothetical protein SPMU_02950 [Sphingomonas mucosissima]